MNFHNLLCLVTIIACKMSRGEALSTTNNLFPNIADISRASPLLTEFFHGYFTAKSLHNATSWLEFFHPRQVVYYDATMGEGFSSKSQLVPAFTELTQEWPKNATSYPLQILGNSDSAIIHYVDTPGLFGNAEIRSISAVDFRDGKVTRQVDYWDRRRNPDDNAGPIDQYPYSLGVETVDQKATPEIIRTAYQLNAALAANDTDAAAILFSYDAVWIDLALRTRQEGQLAIGRYLRRALGSLPFGPGTSVRHVLGCAQGGGYEWQAAHNSTLNGITALELDDNGSITQFTTSWDGSRLNDSALQALVTVAIES